jgi:hypothetical protein
MFFIKIKKNQQKFQQKNMFVQKQVKPTVAKRPYRDKKQKCNFLFF